MFIVRAVENCTPTLSQKTGLALTLVKHGGITGQEFGQCYQRRRNGCVNNAYHKTHLTLSSQYVHVHISYHVYRATYHIISGASKYSH